ncbi:hypothetical protein RB2654_14250 [Rhodobacterales bacterium HTCC2654]|uniref:Uncharacterized protein n=1 Tax=Maritimibacter alkaliphilus HTCC2654 TaxID=314271 RepID=A3VGP9_9RHOB|nr:hypothetical protein RB2654_14250 [Rhodobacterales bacterium HTCC2654] [Maritimibacter alkaliphilus HTCC2654]
MDRLEQAYGCVGERQVFGAFLFGVVGWLYPDAPNKVKIAPF